MKWKIALVLLLSLTIGFILFVNSQEKDFDVYLIEDHEGQMAIPVNRAAPVYAKSQIEIKAPIDTVWNLITRVENWPDWQENINSVSAIGNLSEGMVFKWESGAIKFESVVHTLIPKTYFGWTGKIFGTYAIHNWTFTHNGDYTRVEVEESLQGALPLILSGYFQNVVEEGLGQSLNDLRNAAEI